MAPKGSILLVEDNIELNANNLRALKLLDYDVHPALTLAEAKNWLNKNEPDVILLDVMLPDGDGIDFCAAIRAQTSAHILFLTAKTDHADRVHGLAKGGDDYITKPFHPEELLARVDAAMRRRKMSQKHNTRSAENIDEKKFLDFATFYHLTEKENEVLLLILGKASTKEMAKKMAISAKGIEFHVSNILHKIHIQKRSDVLQTYAKWKE